MSANRAPRTRDQAFAVRSAKLCKRAGLVNRLGLVEMPPYGESEENRPSDEQFIAAKLADTHDWFAKTPVEMVLNDGIVVFATEGGKGMRWLDRD